MVVDAAESGAGTEPVGVVLLEDVLSEALHRLQGALLRSLFWCRCRAVNSISGGGGVTLKLWEEEEII